MDNDAITTHALRLLGLLAIVLVNGFFVAAEFAFVKLRDTQLDALIVAGHRRARLARHILRHLVMVSTRPEAVSRRPAEDPGIARAPATQAGHCRDISAA